MTSVTELRFQVREQFVRESQAFDAHYATHAATLHQDDCSTCFEYRDRVKRLMNLAIDAMGRVLEDAEKNRVTPPRLRLVR